MLKKPFIPIGRIGNNDYYYLKDSTMPYSLLVYNTSETITYEKKTLFGNRVVEKKHITAQKALPLNTLVLYLIYQASLLNKETYELDVEDNKIFTYPVWSEYDFDDIRTTFKKAIIEVAGKSNYDFMYTPVNETAISLNRRGDYSFICEETIGMYHKSNWLARTTKYGALGIVEVCSVGTDKSNITNNVNFHLLDRSLIEKITVDFLSGKLTRQDDNKKIEVEDLDKKEK